MCIVFAQIFHFSLLFVVLTFLLLGVVHSYLRAAFRGVKMIVITPTYVIQFKLVKLRVQQHEESENN